MKSPVRKIPALPKEVMRSEKVWNVGIYCRVSTTERKQLDSLTMQVSELTRKVYRTAGWILTDTFIDVSSARKGSQRSEFLRMIDECVLGNINLVLTKSISRFG